MKQFWLILILWLAFGLRLYHLDTQSIWWDEGHSIFVAQHSVTDIPTLPAMDVHPPAYFWLLHGWLTVTGLTEFALRYLSVIFSLLTIPLMARFAHSLTNPHPNPHPQPLSREERGVKLHPNPLPVGQGVNPHPTPLPVGQGVKLHPNPLPVGQGVKLHPSPSGRGAGGEGSFAPLLTALLAALSPMYVAYAQEVRSYAMLTCLATGSTYLLWLIITEAKSSDLSVKSKDLDSRRYLFLYIGLTAACLYTHYFTVFLLLFHNVTFLIWAIKTTLPPPDIGGGDSNSPPDVGGGWGGVKTWLTSQAAILLLFAPQLRLAARQVSDYANPNLMPPTLMEFLSRCAQAYTVGLAIDPITASKGMGLLGGIFILSCLVGLSNNRKATFFLISWLIIPLTAYFFVLQIRPSFEPRYLMLITPAMFLLWGIIPSWRGAAITLMLTVPVFTISLHSYYTNEAYFKADAAGVTHWLATETTPRDVVFVDVPHPFHYYAAQIPAPTRYLFVDIHTASDILTRETSNHDRLFWLTWSGSDTDPRGVIPFLAEKQGEKLGQRDFRGYKVQWFSLSGQPFSLPTELPPIEAKFGDILQLDSAAFGLSASQRAWATLHFTLLKATPINYKVSLRLRSMTGETVAQVDQELLNDRHFKTAAWPLNDRALNQAMNVYLLPAVPAAIYRLEVVVYNVEPPHPSEGVFGAAASADNAAAVLGEVK